MPAKIYAKKVDEDEKMVYYSFGLIKNDLTGLAKIEKRTLKIHIEDQKSEKFGEQLIVGLLEKMVKGYGENGIFPEEVSSECMK